MKKIIISGCIGLLIAHTIGAVDGKHINGRAVSVQSRSAGIDWHDLYNDCDGKAGSLDLFTILGGRVAKVDTIVSMWTALCYSPSFNMNGTKIAFYQLGRKASTTTSRVSINGDTTYLCYYDLATDKVQKCVALASEPWMHDDGGLAWPAGDEIYYLNPKGNNVVMDEVCKYNITTKVRTSVHTYNLNNGASCFRRFSLNLAADRIGYQVINITGNFYGNGVGPFPNFTISGGDCNATISPSGNYWCAFHGTHTELYFSYYNSGTGSLPEVAPLPSGHKNSAGTVINGMILLYEFQALIPNDTFLIPGVSNVENPAYACNSDKWVLQHVGWYGHAGNIGNGSNVVACNWVDMAAIRISNNPYLFGYNSMPPCNNIGGRDCCGGCGIVKYNNEKGDLWADGGSVNAGKYEDAKGAWHAMANGGTDYVPISVTGMRNPGRAETCRRDPGVSVGLGAEGRVIDIRTTGVGTTGVSVTDIHGRTVFRGSTGVGMHASTGRLAVGTYEVFVTRQGQSFTQHVLVR
jgi:hypothetical protein